MQELCGRDGKTDVTKAKSRAWTRRNPFLSYQQNLTLQAALSIRVTSNHIAVLSLQSRSLKGYVITCSIPLLLCCRVGRRTTLSSSCSPPARPPARAGRCSATRSLTQLDFHGIDLSSGEAGISQSYKGCFKKFSRFYHFSHSLQFAFLAFEKRHTAVLWITAVPFGSRRRRPDARLG